MLRPKGNAPPLTQWQCSLSAPVHPSAKVSLENVTTRITTPYSFRLGLFLSVLRLHLMVEISSEAVPRLIATQEVQGCGVQLCRRSEMSGVTLSASAGERRRESVESRLAIAMHPTLTRSTSLKSTSSIERSHGNRAHTHQRSARPPRGSRQSSPASRSTASLTGSTPKPSGRVTPSTRAVR